MTLAQLIFIVFLCLHKLTFVGFQFDQSSYKTCKHSSYAIYARTQQKLTRKDNKFLGLAQRVLVLLNYGKRNV